MALLEPGQRRAVADQHLGAGMEALQESLDILLDRDPADIEQQRPLEARESGMMRRLGAEMAEVDPPAPAPGLGDAMGVQLPFDRGGRNQNRGSGRMEPANVAPEPAGRQAGAPGDIIGKLGVIGGGERPAAAQAPGTRGQAERSFGGDVDGVRSGGDDPLRHPAAACHGQPDLRIGRAADRAELVGGDRPHFMAHRDQLGAHRLQRPHDAVDLRRPGVGNDQDAHQAAA